MTFTQLEYFCAVCRYGSISKAAEALFVSHPTISVAIKSLEKEFSLELYTHMGNKVVLTEDGRAFYRRAVDILQRCDDMYANFAGRPEDSYRVHVGIPPIRGVALFPQLLRAFQAVHAVPVVLHEYSSKRSLEKLTNGELDCCLVNFKDQTPAQFNCRILLKDRFAFCIARQHPLAKKEYITAKDLRDVPLILQNDDSVLNQPILQSLYKENITPRIVLCSSQVMTILDFIREGSGGAFLYETMAASLCSDEDKGFQDIAVIPFCPELRENLVLAWPKGGYVNRNVKTWIHFVQEYFA